MEAPTLFHPVVKAWFEQRFPRGPTPAQSGGWPAIARGEDTLIAAPTGSGKTLAAFLVCIDRLFREAEEGALPDTTDVVYVSPLKALASDVHVNLERPLAEIRALATERGIVLPEIRALVRSGDTPASARAAMLKRPPHILITTPESLYLLLTAEKPRGMLGRVRTVIVDEIHAVARDKRGSHLFLSLERLVALCDEPPLRIGLSATQHPIERVARLLVGAGPERSREDGSPRCTIVDCGHRRRLDLQLEVPESELASVCSHEQWAEILDRIAAHVEKHRTTLVFVNTRRLSERLAHLLAERLGADRVAAHHGSLSKDRRLRVERRLREGELRVLVATASLELGIDVGPVELVCQIGSPRSLATFLQRVGRSGHAMGAIPKGRFYATTRDELVEGAALLRGVQAGRLDKLCLPEAPLDILAQQIVAACAAENWKEDELYALVRRADAFASLPREDFDAVVEMLAEGVQTGRGRRGAYLHRDRVHGMLRGRRHARISALTSGGAIPDRADYRVLAGADDTFVGTVDEDWAIESQAGDIFLLGSTSWRIRRVEPGVVRVVDAGGAPPTVPFWLGEAPARTAELSIEVSELRREMGEILEESGVAAAQRFAMQEIGLVEAAAEQLARYLEAGRASLGVVPTQRDIVIERFFDESGGAQLVVHAPFGGRINRGFGLALRKRFCRSFDFELQAAANDDAVVISLGPHHSFPLDEVPRMLSPDAVEEVLAQAMLASPLFAARWRWNLGRALIVLRMRGGRRNPPAIQRMEADDLMAAIFPRLAGCQENQTGPVEIPEHPIVRQTIHDCLHEAADVSGLERMLRDVRSGEIRVHLRETTEPSPFAYEILNGRPYTFLDNAPLEERRTRAVAMRRGLPESARDLGRLDGSAIERVREEAQPSPRDAEELHDLLLSLGWMRPRPEWREFFRSLAGERRAAIAETGAGVFWVAAEREPTLRAGLGDAKLTPALEPPEGLAPETEESASELAVRGHLDTSGPVTLEEIATEVGLRPNAVEIALASLEAEGFALRGHFDPGRSAEEREWCCRRLLARIHRYTQDRLRSEIEPVTARDFLRFLLRWHHVTPDTQREGRRGLLAVVEQLQGFELAAGAWETSVFASRVADYKSAWLDDLCLSGEVVWARLALRGAATEEGGRGGVVPSRATPITFAGREDLPWLLTGIREDAEPARPGEGAARDVLEALRDRGALFLQEIVAATGRLPIEVEEGLWDLVSRGLVTADGFQSVRGLLASRGASAGRQPRRGARQRLRRGGRGRVGPEGRWALLHGTNETPDPEELAEALAEQLLARWGVIFRDLLVRETFAVPWRHVLYALRRMEARGTIRGGRFVSGFVGEQYALPGAVESLRRVRRIEKSGEIVRLSAVDPLNLVGILDESPRVPAIATRYVIYRDGEPLAESESAEA